MIDEKEALKNGVLRVAELMIVSAKTAPKARGMDNLSMVIIAEREEIEKLARKMEDLASLYGDFFKRDADTIRKSDAVVLIGCKIIDIGLKKPDVYRYDPNLVNSIVNLGIALGSAVKTASMMNVDNRIMYSVGVAAQELKIIDADIVYGIPLSAKSKNIFFDRVWPPRTS
ncbi:MAG: DUF2148 domain-containing protein [Desulfurococcaceae archaeon]